jgi:hypothetical protein
MAYGEARRAAHAARRARARQLRAEGLTLAVIAERLGCSPASASTLVRDIDPRPRPARRPPARPAARPPTPTGGDDASA